ncbi:Uncharacterized transporter C22F8.04 [Taphrina deformans PYCC 5710]|uniref:Uncharacterized transporter C22F8.04 n=1 Tax=Taphrina deformans (strain PYCC 5710 / ATCC 11124 / CBS 356.35 / IMI 108563 / JCM 9778 / NBRC 8474) TaxID=1097556 RepID=R4X6N8_TAPDE|nr:Uncharacterized transporter C22F8.04 [Taphrina deformans PYCC 5710]|eukprot:CCG80856.1 Uncharacterized transporter C22F8.04 [Taphrina deformans PYCC 5710]
MLQILQKGQPVSRSELATLLAVQTVIFVLQAILNKSALVSLPAPLLLLLLESFITVCLIFGGYSLGYYELRSTKHHWSTIRSLRGVILAKLASGVTRTYCMEAVDGSVFNLVRGLVLPFAVALSAIYLTAPSKISLIPIAVVCIGFYFGTVSEHTDLETIGGPYGLFIGVLSSFFAAFDLTITKMYLDTYSFYDILYVTNLATVLFTGPMIYLGSEYVDHLIIAEMSHIESRNLNSFLFIALICGVLTFISAILALVQLDITSPTTHQITTSARGVLQSVLSVWILDESMEMPQIISIGVILAGTLGYTYIKELERRREELPLKHNDKVYEKLKMKGDESMV